MKAKQPALFDLNQYQAKQPNIGDWSFDVIGDDPSWSQPQPEFSVGDKVCDRNMERHGDQVFEITGISDGIGWAYLAAVDGSFKSMLPLSELRLAPAELSYVTDSVVEDTPALHKTNDSPPELSYVTKSGVEDAQALHKTLARVKSDCLLLTPHERLALRDWLLDAIASDEETFDAPIKSSREVVEVRREGAIVYQLEKVRCGKARCRSCPHGPYWYAYSRKGGRVTSKYVGKNL